jgi:hypothetical protein
MADEPLPFLMAYPASFCESPEEARLNILRMIEAGIPGWDAGHAAWADMLRRQLKRPNRTRKFNRHGARFSAAEWVWLMTSLLEDCESAARHSSAGPEPAGDSATVVLTSDSGSGCGDDFQAPALRLPAEPD